MPSTNVFNELCVKISLLRSIEKIITVCNAVYFHLCIDLMHILPPLQPRDSMAHITRGLPNGSKDWPRCSECGCQLPLTDWTVQEFLHKSNIHLFTDKFHEHSQHMLRIFLVTKDQT